MNRQVIESPEPPAFSGRMIFPTALLMLKAPVEGAVKTRLGREIGPGAATRAYRALVEHQCAQIPPGWRVHICHEPEGARAGMREWLGEAHRYSSQAAGDLGARLAAATEEHFRLGGGPLIILGGDCPYLICERLMEVAVALENADAVLVPALDGGYCLIALRRPEADVFRSIAWSTGAVLAQTRQRLAERGLAWRELAAAEDVDDRASWLRAVRAFPHLGEQSP